MVTLEQIQERINGLQVMAIEKKCVHLLVSLHSMDYHPWFCVSVRRTNGEYISEIVELNKTGLKYLQKIEDFICQNKQETINVSVEIDLSYDKNRNSIDDAISAATDLVINKTPHTIDNGVEINNVKINETNVKF